MPSATPTVLVTNGQIQWDELARLYRDAKTDAERDEAFGLIVDAVAADPDLPDDTDFAAGAHEFLRNRGLEGR